MTLPHISPQRAKEISARKKAGLPLSVNRKQPIEQMRQVLIVAGFFTLLGVLLGTSVTPWGYALSGLVGAGLMFAGLTGICALGKLLMLMPWNARAAACSVDFGASQGVKGVEVKG